MKIKITVHAKAKINKLVVSSLETSKQYKIKIYTTTPPEQNKANLEVVSIIGKWLNIQKNRIKILHGHHFKDKIIEIQDLKFAYLCEKLNNYRFNLRKNS